MSLDLAKSIVQKELLNSDDFDEVEFDLFGGEPSLYFDIVKNLVEWTDGRFTKPHIFFLETNGTLIHGEYQKWLTKYKEYVNVGISLDGTRESHNKNRCNSYDLIDIDFFVKTYPDQSIRMTICKDTIHNLSNDVIHLHNLGFKEVVSVFAHGVDWNLDNIEEILSRELMILCDYYINNPTIKECSIFNMNLESLVQKQKLTKWCGTGTNMIAYDVNGKTYPCHVFQPNTTENDSYNYIDFNCIEDFSDPDCAGCGIEAICPNCYGMNYIQNGDVLKRDKGLCNIVKITAKATSYLTAKKIELGLRDFEKENLYRTIKSINMIQNELFI
jgi:radical SAM protein with 4Fe4S-binding SPASM domain